jgi:TRAP-type C4-dicarboxylate transport system substrate-binding protein
MNARWKAKDWKAKDKMRKPMAAWIGVLMFVLPGSARVASAVETQYIRIATLAPRDSDLAKGFIKLDQGLRAATHNAWGIRLYPSGVAGDETDVIRKMKVGQMDASLITSIGLSQIVREVDVLNAPGVIGNYVQLEAVQKALAPEWEAAFAKAGFRLLAWGETGQYRWFAKKPITRPSDIKTMRPWVWPASHVQKEIFKVIGANGVPLGVPEVYGALQTGMVDMVINTAVAIIALQWHSSLKCMTAKPVGGVLVGAMLMNSDKWQSMPADAQKHVQGEITKNTDSDKKDIRSADERSFQTLVKRGYTASTWDAAAEKELAVVSEKVRKQLVGRTYSVELLNRAMAIAQAAK